MSCIRPKRPITSRPWLRTWLSIGALLPALLCCPVGTSAETRYVTDELSVTLRAGESTRYKILKNLQSGTPVEVLEVDESSNYARVRTEDDKVGYVLIHQLQDEPVARDRLAEVEQRLAEYEQDPGTLTARLGRLQTEHKQLRENMQALGRDKQRLEQELATIRRASANIVEITDERERLRMQVAELTRIRADLEQENRELANQSTQRWFLIGAGVLGGGILLGLILPRLRLGRRKSTWGSL
jgi:SH3 domain protein